MNVLALIGCLCLLASGTAVGGERQDGAIARSPSARPALQPTGTGVNTQGAAPHVTTQPRINTELGPLLHRLIAWIADHGHYSPTDPPRILMEDESTLAKRFYGREPADDAPLKVKALYDHASQSVLLCDCWKADDVFDQSVLLHELVHHVQRRNHAKAQCKAALEAQPYQLQAKWLAEQGVKHPYKAMGTDRFTIDVLSTCMD